VEEAAWLAVPLEPDGGAGVEERGTEDILGEKMVRGGPGG